MIDETQTTEAAPVKVKKKRGRPAKAAKVKATRTNPFEKVFGALAPLVRNFTKAQRTELRRAVNADSSKLDALNTKIEKLQAKANIVAGAAEIVQEYREKLQGISDLITKAGE